MRNRLPATMGAVLLLAGLAVFTTPAPAQACSCVAPDARMVLDGDAALIGTVTTVTRVGTDGIWTLEVELDVFDNLGESVAVGSVWGDGANCGLTLTEDTTVGMVLYRAEAGWSSSGCSVVSPELVDAVFADLGVTDTTVVPATTVPPTTNPPRPTVTAPPATAPPATGPTTTGLAAAPADPVDGAVWPIVVVAAGTVLLAAAAGLGWWARR